MGKKVTLSAKAYSALRAAKRSEEESLSQVILRHVPPPIRTFGDLEKHLDSLDGAVLDEIDWGYLKRLKGRKARRAH